MIIDYVVISSDDNTLYKDFYEIVSNQWNKLGYKVFYINITDNDTEIIENEYGLIKNIKSIEGVDSGFQSQVVRLYSSVLLKDKNLLMSDIDMIPLNSDYFYERSKDVPDNKVLIYSGQPYANVPYYPMCYILGNGVVLSKELNLPNNYNDFIDKLVNYSNMDWNTDEKYFYENTINSKNIIILKDRDFKRRIDRGNWSYDLNKLKSGHYIDSHMLRPYKLYEQHIKKIIL